MRKSVHAGNVQQDFGFGQKKALDANKSYDFVAIPTALKF